jgi:hypothetical protein
MKIDYFEGVSFVIRSMYRDYRNKKKESRFAIAACTANNYSDCPGHPKGSHDSGIVFDGFYYTNGEHNFTQMVPFNYRHKNLQVIKMVDIGMTEKLTNMFDVERNVEFFRRICKIFPMCTFMVHAEIKKVMIDFAPDLQFRIYGDTNKGWKHHAHFHCSLGRKINFDVEI